MQDEERATQDEVERRLALLEGPTKLDRRFEFGDFMSLAVLGLFAPIVMIVIGWGLGE